MVTLAPIGVARYLLLGIAPLVLLACPPSKSGPARTSSSAAPASASPSTSSTPTASASSTAAATDVKFGSTRWKVGDVVTQTVTEEDVASDASAGGKTKEVLRLVVRWKALEVADGTVTRCQFTPLEAELRVVPASGEPKQEPHPLVKAESVGKTFEYEHAKEQLTDAEGRPVADGKLQSVASAGFWASTPKSAADVLELFEEAKATVDELGATTSASFGGVHDDEKTGERVATFDIVTRFKDASGSRCKYVYRLRDGQKQSHECNGTGGRESHVTITRSYESKSAD